MAKAAQTDVPRPIVFIPGLGGSSLVDAASGQSVFGEPGTRFEDLSALVLPRDTSKIRLVPDRVLFEPFDAKGLITHDYSRVLKELDRLGYVQGETLYLFAYDWRLSNFENARRLRAFLAASDLLGRGVDILAHGMGGLVATLYLQTHPDDNGVRTFAAVAVPHFGSLRTLRALMEGFPAWGVTNWAVVPAGDRDLVLDVFGSFESVYELLPHYVGCCNVRLVNGLVPFDAMSPDDWTRYGILGRVDALRAERNLQSFFDDPWVMENFKRAQRLREIIRRPLPSNVRKVVVSSDQRRTPFQVMLDPYDDEGDIWIQLKRAGDDVVPRVSALGANDAAWVLHSRAGHYEIFNDAQLWQDLGTILKTDGAL
ncbi:MAG: hypothetical protein QNJ92_10000 [Alphaproteobacteria bacterium]|nr:hypothetical protein [Alphaproteobacteria bacterium]